MSIFTDLTCSNDSVPTKITEDFRSSIINQLTSLFGSFQNWFIAGSFANLRVTCPNDIDLYFYTKKDFTTAKRILNTHPKTRFVFGSKFAETYSLTKIPYPVQFISKVVGNPQEIFDSMDINVCKQAILPNHTHLIDKTALDQLTLNKECIAMDSFSRYIKYYQRYNPKRNLDRAFCYLFDTYGEDTTLVESYYSKQAERINVILYHLFRSHKQHGTKYISNRVQNYLVDKIQDSVPELLI
jgi:hypothetical protein